MAESLFRAGKELMGQGRINEACPKFAESMRLDPAVGSLLNLARCHERQGKTATAWAEYLRAATMAESRGQKDRAEGARHYAAELEARLSQLTIEAPEPVPGLKIRRGSVEVRQSAWGVPVAVDPGSHTIRASATGYQSWSVEVTLGPASDRRTVTIPPLSPAAGGGGSESSEAEEEAGAGLAYYALATTATGIGLAGLVVGAAFGVRASDKWDDAQAQCPDAPTYCDAAGVELNGQAHDAAAVSTVGFVIGGVGLAGATVLWILAARASSSGDEGVGSGMGIAPVVAQRSVGLSAWGAF